MSSNMSSNMSHTYRQNENKDIDSGLNRMMNEIYVHVSMNWDTIKKNENIMKSLDTDSNNMCKKLKTVHSELNDDMIKMRTFTIMIMLFMMVCFPNNYEEVIERTRLLDDSCQMINFTNDLENLSINELNNNDNA